MSPVSHSNFHDHFEEIKPQRIAIEEERKDRDDEKRRWIEERKKVFMNGVNNFKQEMKSFDNKQYSPCD